MRDGGGYLDVLARKLPNIPQTAIFDDADRTRAPLPQGQIGKMTRNCLFSGDFLPSICCFGSIRPIEVGLWPPARLNIPRTCTDQYPRRMAGSSRDIDQNYRKFSQYEKFCLTNCQQAWRAATITETFL
jgi:hypothetical protein